MITKQSPKELEKRGYTFEKIAFKLLTHEHNNKLIETEATIIDITDTQTVMTEASYRCPDCKGCTEIELDYPFKIPKIPNKCAFCGHSVKLDLSTRTSKYTYIRNMTISSDNRDKDITLVLIGDLCNGNYQINDKINIKGHFYYSQKGKKFTPTIMCGEINILETNTSQIPKSEGTYRDDEGYTNWVTKINNRDKICQICGGTKHLEAHHLYNYNNYPDLRTDTGNGILLCTFCHKKFHSYYGNDVTPSDLIRFIYQFRRS